MAVFKLSTGNLLVTLTGWSPNGLVHGQVQVEPECDEFPLLEPHSIPMRPQDEAAFRLLRGCGLPFEFKPWKMARQRFRRCVR